MQGCANDYGKLIGKVAVVRMAFGCPDAVPLLTDWKKLGAMTTKGIDYSMNTTNSEADDSKGLVENLVTSMDLTISGDGEFRKNDKANEIGAFRMSKYIFDEIQPGGSRRSGFASTSLGKMRALISWGISTPPHGLVTSAPATFPPSLVSGRLQMLTRLCSRLLQSLWCSAQT